MKVTGIVKVVSERESEPAACGWLVSLSALVWLKSGV